MKNEPKTWDAEYYLEAGGEPKTMKVEGRTRMEAIENLAETLAKDGLRANWLVSLDRA